MSDSEDASATSVQSHRIDGRLRYRLLTGPDTVLFCERVSEALADGYVLHGSPSITFDGTATYVAQAVVLAGTAISPTNDE
ncbi:MAG: hypothetical protein ACI81L_003311 [Verrucomicrobiales bacterium]